VRFLVGDINITDEGNIIFRKRIIVRKIFKSLTDQGTLPPSATCKKKSSDDVSLQLISSIIHSKQILKNAVLKNMKKVIILAQES